MHDIGRTQQNYMGESGQETFEFGQPGEVPGETLGEAFEAGFQEAGTGMETGYETFESYETPETQELPLQESLEMELASELLEVTNEEELDRFLGSLIGRAAKGLGRIVRSPIGHALGGVLKRVAKVALPLAGKAVGGFFGGPVGGMLGGQLASAASRAFGLELEGMSSEDAEFEVARRFVRFASAAVNSAAAAPSGDPNAIAKTAALSAAHKFAPGLVRGDALVPVAGGAPGMAEPCPGRRRRGVWIRRGRRILLLGV